MDGRCGRRLNTDPFSPVENGPLGRSAGASEGDAEPGSIGDRDWEAERGLRAGVGRGQGDEDGPGPVDQGDRKAHGSCAQHDPGCASQAPSRLAMARGPSAPRRSSRLSGGSASCSTRSRRCRASASWRRSPRWATREARRSWTTACASCARATCHRREAFQRTVYRPGELAQFDLCEPLSEIPVGWDQTRRGYLVTCKLPYSRAFAGALVFSADLCRDGPSAARRREREDSLKAAGRRIAQALALGAGLHHSWADGRSAAPRAEPGMTRGLADPCA